MSQPISQHEKIRQITLGSVFIAISLVLGITKIGFIPLPLPTLAGTIFHIPVILAGMLLNPFIGLVCGLIFGVTALMAYPQFPWFVMIPGRLVIPIVSYLVFHGLMLLLKTVRSIHLKLSIAGLITGALGSVTNSACTLGLAYIFRVFGKTGPENWKVIVTIIPVAFVEMVLACILVPSLIIPLYLYFNPKAKQENQ